MQAIFDFSLKSTSKQKTKIEVQKLHVWLYPANFAKYEIQETYKKLISNKHNKNLKFAI